MNPNVKVIFKSLSLSILTVLLSVTVLYAATTVGENISTGGTLNVTGVTTLSGDTSLSTASSTGLVKVHNLRVGRTTGESSAVAGMVFGTCNFKTTSSLNALSDVATSSYVVCGDATGVLADDKVFMQATSSMPYTVFIAAASSTAADTISLRLSVATSTGALTVGKISVNFWAVR